jgi:iron(III) transport system permease protein
VTLSTRLGEAEETATVAPRRSQSHPTGKVVVIAGVVAVFGFLTLVPLGFLVWQTFTDEGALSFDAVLEAYSANTIGPMAINSTLFAIGTAMLAVGLGTVLAYLTTRTDMPFKGPLFVAALTPLVIPGILHTIAWIFLTSPRIGPVNQLLEMLPGSPTLNIFSIWGMIWVEGLHLAPLVFLLMAAAFRSMDPSLEESALSAGASLPRVFASITLPLVKPALLASILLIVIRAFEAFEVPALLGIPGGVWVFTSRIWRALEGVPSDFGLAGAFSLSLLVFTSVLVFLYTRLGKTPRRYQTVTGKGFRPRVVSLGRWRTAAVLFTLGYFAVAVVLPLLNLLYISTQRFYATPSLETIANATLDNYRYTFTHPQVLGALGNSLLLGLGAATTLMLLGAVGAWIVVRSKARGRWLVDGLASIPLVIPGLVVGVALLVVYLRVPIPVYGTLWILFIAYLTRYLPYGMRYATSSMYQVGSELEESAQVSGAGWWYTLRRVHLPLLVPGLVAGWIYIVIVSVRELSSSILLYSPGTEVLSVLIWEQWENGQFTELASLGIVMVGILVVLVAVARRLGARIGIREIG